MGNPTPPSSMLHFTISFTGRNHPNYPHSILYTSLLSRYIAIIHLYLLSPFLDLECLAGYLMPRSHLVHLCIPQAQHTISPYKASRDEQRVQASFTIANVSHEINKICLTGQCVEKLLSCISPAWLLIPAGQAQFPRTHLCPN